MSLLRSAAHHIREGEMTVAGCIVVVENTAPGIGILKEQ